MTCLFTAFRREIAFRPDTYSILAFSCMLLLLQGSALAEVRSPGIGISHELAIERASRISDVHYELSLSLRPHADTMPGREVLRFQLRRGDVKRDVWLDFRDGTLRSAKLNGTNIPLTLVDGHLRLPATQLEGGQNSLEAEFSSRIASSGAAVTRYSDKEDGSEYMYSLFVPMDASMAFPCFDQPDLKARFALTVSAPEDWKVISNTAPHRIEFAGKEPRTSFEETHPISTYLFAFAAGPWVNVHATPGQPNVNVRKSQVKRAEPEVPQLQDITARGLDWLAKYFRQPFPFPKYDIVLIPGFPFGGMEHAGATFLREDGVLFRSAPTANDRFNRNILTLHELTHQWFGDLVTMRWFDDLWLKEGFAQYMAYRCLDKIDPGSEAWKHFYESIKPLAYGIDETPGTTPIFQNIPNLRDAKSAYGAIVYQKAPAILKQLEFRLGADNFRDGLRIYLAQHAYSNAQWADLIAAFHEASEQDVSSWANAWVLHRGMPEVRPSFACESGKLAEVTLIQHDVLGTSFTWPITTQLLLAYPIDKQAHLPGQPTIVSDGAGTSSMRTESIRVSWETPSTHVAEAVGKNCPAFIFANGSDQAYGRFLLDSSSLNVVQAHVAGVRDPLLRSQLYGALWDNVRTVQSSPRSYVELALRELPNEDDETLSTTLGNHTLIALHRYLPEKSRANFVPQLEEIATRRMMTASSVGLRIVSFRTLNGAAETPAARTTLKQLLAGDVTIPGVDLRPLDRWSIVGTLIARGDSDAQRIFDRETRRDRTGDGQKYAWAVQAGKPDAPTKQTYFEQYLRSPTDPGAKPEDWLTQSLRPFNSWNQTSLTEPYVLRALDELPAIKRDRKIFFLGAWLSAFLGDETDPSAETSVQQWLAQPNIDPDLRLKVLENNDELERTLRIRLRFPD